MKRKPYQTAGRTALEVFFKEHPDKQFTAEELHQAVCKQTQTGKSSVYRHISQLCESETVRSFYNKDRQCNLYQYIGEACTCRDHLHEKCIQCGKIEHLDCHISSDFIEHLQKEHGFTLQCNQTILYGICAECRQNGGTPHA